MKLSKFNIYRKEGENLLIYNTLSGGILYLDPPYTQKFYALQKNLKTISDYPDLVENLKKGKILVREDIDEAEALLTQNYMSRFSRLNCSLTLTPTMKCNFVCPYCYEVNKTYPKMERKVIDKLKSLFEQLATEHKYLSISWYGGEPLLGFDIIKELSQKAIELFGDNYYSSMVTNGYLFTDSIIKELNSLRIKDIQITLDGPPEIHNKRRRLPSGEDTFFVILKNIKRIVELAPDVKIVIRVNTDKENIDYVDTILDYLEEFDIRNKIGFYLAPVDNINNTCNSSTCFSNTEFALEQLKFLERNLKRGYNYCHLPQLNVHLCGAVADDNYVIDAIGDIYKCWDDVAYTERKAGNILTDGFTLTKNLTKWLLYDIRDDKECMNCPFLPVCMGGCPNQRINGKSKKCMPIKENAEELIRLLYELSLNKK